MKYIIRFSLVWALILIFSCNKETIVDTPYQVGISKVAYYPLIVLNGPQYVTIAEGEAYNDPGVLATLNGATIPYTTSGTVDASAAPGVYLIEYTATSPDGPGENWRLVVKVPASVLVDPVIIGHDYSGTYLRAATGVTSTWVKIGTGVYTVENPGGSSGVGLNVILTNYSGNTIEIPEQESIVFGGPVSSTAVPYNDGPPATFTYIFNANGYGSGPRTFQKK